MRFPWILTLALVAASLPASAQYKNKAAVKPSREEKTAKGGPAVNARAPRNSSSEQLQRLEQQTVKSAAGSKTSGRPRVAAVKTQREKPNPPIHFTSGTGGRGAGSGSATSSKSRVRTKSSKH